MIGVVEADADELSNSRNAGAEARAAVYRGQGRGTDGKQPPGKCLREQGSVNITHNR